LAASRRGRSDRLPLLAHPFGSCSSSAAGVLTIEAEIYNQAVRVFESARGRHPVLRPASAPVFAVWVTLRLEARVGATRSQRSERDILRRPRTRGEKAVVAGSLGLLAVFLVLPLAVLVERSLAIGGGYGFDAYRALTRPTSALLATPWEAVWNSIVYAAAATLIAVVVGGLAAFAVAESRGPRA
jgi:thiamine transport system permease protein